VSENNSPYPVGKRVSCQNGCVLLMGGLAVAKASFILPSLESLWGCQEIQMEDLNRGASQSSHLQTQTRVQFTMLGRCWGLSQKCPNPGPQDGAWRVTSSVKGFQSLGEVVRCRQRS